MGIADYRDVHAIIAIKCSPQAEAGSFGPVGTAAMVCLTGFYCPAGSAYGLTCPASTTSATGAADVLACLVLPTHGSHGQRMHTCRCCRAPTNGPIPVIIMED